MLQQEFTSQSGQEVPFGENRHRIQIVAFLSPFRGCTSFTNQTRLLTDEDATVMPMQVGMGTAGFRVLTVYEDEWLEFGKMMCDLETRKQLEILNSSQRFLYRSRMTATSYMKTEFQQDDVLIDDDGGNPQIVPPRPIAGDISLPKPEHQ